MDEQTRLQRAERIAELAREVGFETALIGAVALSAHGYVRATLDLDLGSDTELFKLRELQARLESSGLHTELRTPDAEDSLEIWEHEDAEGEPIDAIEIVNFSNHWRPGMRTPGRDAVRRAQPIAEGSPLRCVQLADLIALKLYSGGANDKVDVVNLLARNPDADLDAIREVCSKYGFGQTLEELIAASRSE